MNKKNQKISTTKGLEIINPDAAGIDIGSKVHYVCVPEGRDTVRIKSFGCFTQAHLFDQSILQRFVGPFHTTFCLGRMGTDQFNSKAPQSPVKLCIRQSSVHTILLGFPENTMLIAIVTHGSPVRLHMLLDAPHLKVG